MLLPARHIIWVLVALIALTTPLSASAAERSDAFVDDDHSRFEPFIESAARRGLIRGCNPPHNTLVCPYDTVTRAETAMMLARAAELSAGAGDHFTDDDGRAAEPAIEALVAVGATRGCEPERFCPEGALTRGQFAVLLGGVLGWTPTDSVWPFIDLDGSPFGPDLARLGRDGHLEPCDAPVGRRMCVDQAVTRAEAVATIASALDLAPHAVQSGAGGPAVDFSDGFDTLALWDGRSPGSRNRVALTDGGYRGRGLRVTIPRASHYGTDFRLDLEEVAGAEPERLFFRYMLRLDDDWSPVWSGKLPGFSGVYGRSGKGGYQSTTSSPGWSARVQFFGTRDGDPRARLGYYVYHLGQQRRYGDSMMWNEAGKLRPGEWYCIEGEVDLNTPGLADGSLRAWVDGTPAFDVAGIEFRRPAEPKIRIESFWFNVYYGGKPVAERDMGLTVDEVAVDTERVGCGAGSALQRAGSGDVTGDGFDERLAWGTCPGGTCFELTRTTTKGTSADRMGEGGWFSLDAHRVGFAVADVDGDGRDDVVYPGRCRTSQRCWRVHRSAGTSLVAGEDWGTGTRFSSSTDGLVSGDWNGDRLDDITYRGICGSDPHPCWRMHLSTGHGMAKPADWGTPAPAEASLPVAADVNGDGRDDLVYLAPCGEKLCWHTQVSKKKSFGDVRRLGRARAGERDSGRWFDVDEDGDADLVTARTREKGGSVVTIRLTERARLGKPVVASELDGRFADIVLRSRGDGPVEAVVAGSCGEDQPRCGRRRLVWNGAFVTPADYREAMIRKSLFEGPIRLD